MGFLQNSFAFDPQQGAFRHNAQYWIRRSGKGVKLCHNFREMRSANSKAVRTPSSPPISEMNFNHPAASAMLWASFARVKS